MYWCDWNEPGEVYQGEAARKNIEDRGGMAEPWNVKYGIPTKDMSIIAGGIVWVFVE